MCPLATSEVGAIRMMGLVMTEHELADDEGGELDSVVQRDGVMERLAKLLADSAAPPDSRVRLKEALVRGDFNTIIESGETAQ